MNTQYQKLPVAKNNFNPIILKRIAAFSIDYICIQLIKIFCFMAYVSAITNHLNFIPQSEKFNLITSIFKIDLTITIVIFISYFTTTQYLYNGTTLGMKLFNLKVINTNRTVNGLKIDLNLRQSFWKTMSFTTIIFALILSWETFSNANGIKALSLSSHFSLIAFVVSSALFCLPIFRKDNKTLGDIISGTEIINNKVSKNAALIQLVPDQDIHFQWGHSHSEEDYKKAG